MVSTTELVNKVRRVVTAAGRAEIFADLRQAYFSKSYLFEFEFEFEI